MDGRGGNAFDWDELFPLVLCGELSVILPENKEACALDNLLRISYVFIVTLSYILR